MSESLSSVRFASTTSVNSISSAELLEPRESRVEKRASIDVRAFVKESKDSSITDRYNFDATREIGAGGYGKVFVGEDKQFNQKRVAIKKVVKKDQQVTEVFRREISIMKLLDHPNICKLFETYEQGRFIYFVMELCEGREVFDRIAESEEGYISERASADIIKQVALALNYAHSREIAHRDLKPENVVFCTKDPEDNRVKVIDWGLGFYFGQGRMKSAVGSLTYAAPEVLDAKGKNYSKACDLWSLGVLAYVMMSGKPPFWGSHDHQLNAMKREQYPTNESPWDDITKEAKDFIKILFKADPNQRPTLERLLKHPFFDAHLEVSQDVSHRVFNNVKTFCKKDPFFNLVVASVARQLDHKHLDDVHQVFRDMDTNHDGVLSLAELKAGFGKLGLSSEAEVEELFAGLDLDHSGSIDYTEFVAAGVGERTTNQEHVLYAAFKAFDVNNDDGKISREEIMQVLQKADVKKVWSMDNYEAFVDEIMQICDIDGDGEISFEEFKLMMQQENIVKVAAQVLQRARSEEDSESTRRPCIKSTALPMMLRTRSSSITPNTREELRTAQVVLPPDARPESHVSSAAPPVSTAAVPARQEEGCCAGVKCAIM